MAKLHTDIAGGRSDGILQIDHGLGLEPDLVLGIANCLAQGDWEKS